MSLLRNPFTVLAIFIVTFVAAAQPSSRQLVFSAEDDTVADFAELPSAAMKLLMADREDFPDAPHNLRCTRREGFWSTDPSPEILCRTLAISKDSGKNYLVIGVGELRGAHIVPFWIFHCDGNKATLLFKSRSDQIGILPTTSHGYRDIELTWIFGAGSTIRTTRFRFNGTRYAQFASHEDHN